MLNLLLYLLVLAIMNVPSVVAMYRVNVTKLTCVSQNPLPCSVPGECAPQLTLAQDLECKVEQQASIHVYAQKVKAGHDTVHLRCCSPAG